MPSYLTRHQLASALGVFLQRDVTGRFGKHDSEPSPQWLVNQKKHNRTNWYLEEHTWTYYILCIYYVYIYKHSHQPLFLLRCRPCLSRLNEIGNIETNLDPKRKSLNSSNGAQHSTSGQTQEKECPPCPLGPSPHRGNPKHATLDPFKIAKINPPPGIFLLGFRKELAFETSSLVFEAIFSFAPFRGGVVGLEARATNKMGWFRVYPRKRKDIVMYVHIYIERERELFCLFLCTLFCVFWALCI